MEGLESEDDAAGPAHARWEDEERGRSGGGGAAEDEIKFIDVQPAKGEKAAGQNFLYIRGQKGQNFLYIRGQVRIFYILAAGQNFLYIRMCSLYDDPNHAKLLQLAARAEQDTRTRLARWCRRFSCAAFPV